MASEPDYKARRARWRPNLPLYVLLLRPEPPTRWHAGPTRRPRGGHADQSRRRVACAPHHLWHAIRRLRAAGCAAPKRALRLGGAFVLLGAPGHAAARGAACPRGMIAMSGTDARDKRYQQRSGKGAEVGDRYKARVGRHADRLRNLFFTYVLLARAVAKASDMLVRHITAHELPGLNPRILGGRSSPKGHGIVAPKRQSDTWRRRRRATVASSPKRQASVRCRTTTAWRCRTRPKVGSCSSA